MIDTVNTQNTQDTQIPQISEAAKRAKRGKVIGQILLYAVLILYALVILFPFSVVISTSLKTVGEAKSPVFSWIPQEGFQFDSYLIALGMKEDLGLPSFPFITSFLNTLLYVLPPTIIGLLVGSMSAYAFAKLNFRAKNIMYAVLLSTMMLPGAITLTPSYAIYDLLGWVGTPLPLVLPGLFSSAACVFFMRQFFTGIPDSILEAAKLDGMGYLGIFFTMILPLSVPALVAQGLLGFIGGYNDYLAPSLYLLDPSMATLQIALRNFAGQHVLYPNNVMAATLIALLPTLIIYFIAQDFFIEGIAASAIKG